MTKKSIEELSTVVGNITVAIDLMEQTSKIYDYTSELPDAIAILNRIREHALNRLYVKGAIVISDPESGEIQYG